MTDYTILLNPYIAEKFGINRAAVLCQLYYLSKHPPRDAIIDAENNIVWIERSYKDWAKYTFRWLSPSGIRKIFDFLRACHLVEAIPAEHDNWYRLTPQGIALFEKHNEPANPSLPPKATPALTQVSPMVTPSCPPGTPETIYIKESDKDDSLSLEKYTSFFHDFCFICELNPKVTSHRTQAEKHAKELFDAGYTPEDLKCVSLYWQNDDYRKGRIYPKQVVEIIESAVRRYRLQPIVQAESGIPSRETVTEMSHTSDTSHTSHTSHTPETPDIPDIPESPPLPPPKPTIELPTEVDPHFDAFMVALEWRIGKFYFDTRLAHLRWVSFDEEGVLTLFAGQPESRPYIANQLGRLLAIEYSRLHKQRPVTKIILIAAGQDPVEWINLEHVPNNPPTPSSSTCA